jgi:thiamine-phosphate diphosphorylase
MFADYPILCLITSGRLFPGQSADTHATWLARIAAAAQADITLVQIREPHLDTRALAALVGSAMRAIEGTRTHLVVNDRLDVAIGAGAHGVHLKESSLRSSRVRSIAPPPFIVGRSIHAAGDGSDAGVDYLIFGTVFETQSKPGIAHRGIGALQETVAAASAPVLAIGGISAETLPHVRATGAAGFAAIGYFDVPPQQIAERCARARRLFDTS